MKAKFDKDALQEYEKIFGTENLKKLFHDFQEMSAESFENAKTADLQGLRIIYHNLKSAGKAFGMCGFADACAAVEDKIIEGQGERVLEIDIKNAKMLFEKEITEVCKYFNMRAC